MASTTTTTPTPKSASAPIPKPPVAHSWDKAVWYIPMEDLKEWVGDSVIPGDDDAARPDGLKRESPFAIIKFKKHVSFPRWLWKVYRQRVHSAVEKQLRLFNDIESINTKEKERIFCSVALHTERLKAAEALRSMLNDVLLVPFVLVGAIVMFFGVPSYLNSWFGMSYPAWSGGSYLFYIAAVLALSFFAILPAYFLSRPVPRLMYAWLFVTLPIYLGLVVYSFWFTDIGRAGALIQLLVAGMAGTLSYVCIAGIGASLLLPIGHAFKRRACTRHPDSVLVNGLIEILSTAEKDAGEWGSLALKQKLISQIEEVASCVQNDLPRRLRDKDLRASLWLRGRSRGMAAGLRVLKRWVSTPKLDTRAHFIARVSDSLIHAALGDWDAIPRAKVGKLSQPQLFSRIFGLIRGVVVGLLPLLILLGVQQTSMALKGDVQQYAFIGTLVWAALALLSALDPTLNTRLESFKSIASSILPGLKGN